MIPVKIIKPCLAETPDGKEQVEIPVGTTCEYRGHVTGGMVAVEHEGRRLIVHPGATDIE